MKVFRLVSLADSLSVLNALFGFSGIVYILLYGVGREAYALLCFSAIADGVDGVVASKTEKGKLGKQLDSLADVISFGVLPSIAMVAYDPNLFAFAALLLAFSILRLARFNVESFEDFYGLPTLANALLIFSMLMLSFKSSAIAVVSFLTSLLMVSDIVYPRIRSAPLLVSAFTLLILAALFDLIAPVLTATLAYALYPPARVTAWRLRRLLSRRE